MSGGKVIFTDEGLPNELVKLDIRSQKSNYTRAQTCQVLKASPWRAHTRCDHYKVCSPYQYINYPFQLHIKQEQLAEIFLRTLKIKNENIEIKASPRIWGYRNKVHLHVRWQKKTASLAYHLPEINDRFIHITCCFLISEEMNRLAQAILAIISRHEESAIQEIGIKESSSKKELLLVLYADSSRLTQKFLDSVIELPKTFSIEGIIGITGGNKARKENLIWGKSYIEEKIEGYMFRIGAQSFFQVNTAMLTTMCNDIAQSTHFNAGETIADLYCGVGTFGILLAKKVCRVIGIEASRENTLLLEQNLKINHIENFTVYNEYSETWFRKRVKEPADTLIIDPPRKGIGKEICEHLLKYSCQRIIYISCDPATLLRDLKILLAGYSLERITGYDFFPHTPHIETCTLLVKK